MHVHAVGRVGVARPPRRGPVMPIDVWLDDVHVVEGFFDYGPSGSDPGRIYSFELSVAGPTTTLRAEAPEATLEETIDVSAERWVVLTYELGKTNSGVPSLTLAVSDRPVAFD